MSLNAVRYLSHIQLKVRSAKQKNQEINLINVLKLFFVNFFVMVDGVSKCAKLYQKLRCLKLSVFRIFKKKFFERA